MPYTNLLIDEQDGILILTLNRPKAMNALNTKTMLELQHFFAEDAPAREGLKGIILTGAGEKAFVAGADIKEFLALDTQKGQDMAQRGQDVFFLIERFHKPVIALVNGFALGGGCELSMACHLRIATENARFGQPEVNSLWNSRTVEPSNLASPPRNVGKTVRLHPIPQGLAVLQT